MSTPRDYALQLLSKREYSVLELQEKLIKKFSQDTEKVKKILKEFQKKNWVSDERFTEVFIRNQILTTKSGPRKIYLKLIQKGIDKNLAHKKLKSEFLKKQQQELIHLLAQKKKSEFLRKKKKLSPYELKQKIILYLVRKGYDYDLVRNCNF
jgi:regulatory protein